jgi:hypothetical protein
VRRRGKGMEGERTEESGREGGDKRGRDWIKILGVRCTGHRTHAMEADADDIFAPALAFPSSVLSDGPGPNGLQYFSLFRHSLFHWNCYILCHNKKTKRNCYIVPTCYTNESKKTCYTNESKKTCYTNESKKTCYY